MKIINLNLQFWTGASVSKSHNSHSQPQSVLKGLNDAKRAASDQLLDTVCEATYPAKVLLCFSSSFLFTPPPAAVI